VYKFTFRVFFFERQVVGYSTSKRSEKIG